MANYMCVNRTNYFKVTDAEAFKAFLAKVETDTDESLLVWEKEIDGKLHYAFGIYASIIGVTDKTGEADYDRFIVGLQEYIAEDDAVILFHAGHEKLRCVTGCATVITKNSVDILNIQDIAIRTAQEKLVNPEYSTECDY